ncbi:MAG: DUF2336 domain-containing protein [Alphaproteobacteria bacterium]
MSNDDGQAAFRAAENLKSLVPYMTIDALVDLVGIGNVFCHLSLASSSALTAPVAAALSEIDDRDVSLVLLLNKEITIPDFSLLHMLERCGADAEVMLALEERHETDPAIWKALLAARLKWIAARSDQTTTQETRIITLLWSSPASMRRHYVEALAQLNQITPSLLFQTFRSGATEVAITLLAKASSLPSQAIEYALTTNNPSLIRAIARKAGLADILADDLIEAIDAINNPQSSQERLAA